MAEITDQDRRDARQWAASIDPDMKCWSDRERVAARVILATVEAPTPTLAEAMRTWGAATALNYGEEASFDPLIARAGQIEKERDEASSEVADITEVNHEIRRERDESRAEATALAEDLAGAESEVERLTTERDRLLAQVQGLARRDGYHNSEVRMLTEERDDARAEVERLTAVQKGAESNAESIGPADVRPGDPWLIRVRGRDAVAIRDGHEEWPWSVAFIHGESDEAKDDVVTLVSRLVPAPRVITNPDELDRLAEGSIVRDRAGHAWERYPDEDWYSTEELDDGLSSRRLANYAGTVTVLWEPEA